MATFASLTPTQQAIITGFVDTYLRSDIIQLANILSRFAALDTTWQASVLSLVTSLDAGAAIPTTTGLAAASPLVKEDITGTMTGVEAFLATYNTAAYKQTYLKLGGLTAAITS